MVWPQFFLSDNTFRYLSSRLYTDSVTQDHVEISIVKIHNNFIGLL